MPKEMKIPIAAYEIHGLAVHAAGAQLVPYRYEPGELKANEVEVKISHCGVCHSDIHLIDNDWGLSKFPFVPGHEIVGTVSAAGSAVRDLAVGQRVGIGWQADSCGICEWCRPGRRAPLRRRAANLRRPQWRLRRLHPRQLALCHPRA